MNATIFVDRVWSLADKGSDQFTDSRQVLSFEEAYSWLRQKLSDLTRVSEFGLISRISWHVSDMSGTIVAASDPDRIGHPSQAPIPGHGPVDLFDLDSPEA